MAAIAGEKNKYMSVLLLRKMKCKQIRWCPAAKDPGTGLLRGRSFNIN
jgi:hypothetical protein